MGSASVSRGGRSGSGGRAALSWRDRLTKEGEGQTRGEETHRRNTHKIKGQITHTHAHAHKGMGGIKGKIKDKRMIQNEVHSRQVTQTPAKNNNDENRGYYWQHMEKCENHRQTQIKEKSSREPI